VHGGLLFACTVLAVASVAASGSADSADDRRQVGRLDLEFQAAVKANDAETMTRILHPDMVLVLGDGRVLSRADQLKESRLKLTQYEIQDEEPGTQTVRVVGDTALVTALLRIKGRSSGKHFDRRLWFSDIYVRTPSGWKYLFGQASLPLPSDASGSPLVPNPSQQQGR
jgi:ketosteroid isomerase-like protein